MPGKPRAKCPQCSHEFVIARKHQVYCSPRCRRAAWGARQERTAECPMCTKKFEKVLSHHTYCSNKCRLDAWFQRKVDAALIKQAPFPAPAGRRTK